MADGKKRRSRLIITAATVLVFALLVLSLSSKRLVAVGDCEDLGCGAMMMMDGSGRPLETVFEDCCKDCDHTGWSVKDIPSRQALSPFADLPECPMDRCGKGSFELSATGFNLPWAFLVVSYDKGRP